ncbi:MAG: lipopolysaccharide biosynthesis protein [Candidatus Omnitrophica bacterium]|nr:lipopolysaccharide biosynthesis protein [Candidatus Omnitrophota bacterium]
MDRLQDMFVKDRGLEYPEEQRSLGRRAAISGAWVFTLRFVQRALGFARTIILARLLAPSDFGLMGVAALAINMLDTFSKTGFEAALIQKKEDIKHYLDTAWTVQFLRAAILCALLFFSAPFVAEFFRSPSACSIIRVLALLYLFMGLQNIGTVYFQRDLQFNRRFIMETGGLITNIAVSVMLAFKLRNVWALVYGSVAGSLITCVMSYVLHPYRPKFKLDYPKTKELINYGKWLFGTSILVFLITQGDNAFVGRVMGIAALGFYQMAYGLANASATEVSHVIAQVMFPVYSKMQGDLERLKKAYIEVAQLIIFVAVPISVMITLFARDFTAIFLGEKWLPMVGAMQVLAWGGFLRAASVTAGCVFFAVKRPQIETGWETVRLMTLAIFICPLSMKFGIVGTSLAVCASALVLFIGFTYGLKQAIDLKFIQTLKISFFPMLSSCLLWIFIMFSRRILDTQRTLGFIIAAFLSGIFYLLISYILSKTSGYKIFEIIKARLKASK